MINTRRLVRKLSVNMQGTLNRMHDNKHNYDQRTFFRVIQQSDEAYRLLLGKNPVKLNAGLHLAIPLLHKVQIISMKEYPSQIKEMIAFIKDNVGVKISGTLYSKVHDSYKAIFNVHDLDDSILSLGTSAMRSVIGLFTYDEIIADRQKINQKLLTAVDDACSNWGTEITKFEIQTFLPANKEVEHQLEAERNRRKQLLDTESALNVAEGKRKIAILESEGELAANRNKAEGTLIMERATSDAHKYNTDMETAAIVNQIRELSSVLGNEKLAAEYLIERAKLAHMGNIASGNNNTVYFSNADNGLVKMKTLTDMLDK